MSKQRQVRLPNPLRNPLVVLGFATEVRGWLGDAVKAAAGRGETARFRATKLTVTAFLNELEASANAKLGNQLDA